MCRQLSVLVRTVSIENDLGSCSVLILCRCSLVVKVQWRYPRCIAQRALRRLRLVLNGQLVANTSVVAIMDTGTPLVIWPKAIDKAFWAQIPGTSAHPSKKKPCTFYLYLCDTKFTAALCIDGKDYDISPTTLLSALTRTATLFVSWVAVPSRFSSLVILSSRTGTRSTLTMLPR